MLRQLSLTYLLIIILITLAACNPSNEPLPPPPTDVIELEANQGGVFILSDEQRAELLTEQQSSLAVGEGVAVEERGWATLRLTDFMTAELGRSGELMVQELATDSQSGALAVRQTGGVLLNNFNPDRIENRRFTLQTEFATVTTAGARFLVLPEPEAPVTWIVNLGEAEDEVQVTAAGVTQAVSGGAARWVVAGNAPSEPIPVEMPRFQTWLGGVRTGASQLNLSEILLSPADMLGLTASLTALPTPGQTFELGRSEQGAVQLTLDPIGLFGQPTYTLEDCNEDGNQDIAIRAGRLYFDFRPMLAQVRALDVTVFNRAGPGDGALWVLDLTQAEVGRQLLAVGPDQNQTLSLRASQRFHTAELALSHGCFMGFSLTPPGPDGQPGEARPALASPQDEVIVNVLGSEPAEAEANEAETETPEAQTAPTTRLPEQDPIEAAPLGSNNEAGIIEIDGDSGDWEALAGQGTLNWQRFEAITYDEACAARYPDSDRATDLAGRVGFAYDQTYLYVAFQVEDDGYVIYSGADQRYFLGDSPQLSLDIELLGDYNDSGRSQDDWQVDFLPDFEATRVALWQLATLASREFSEAPAAAAPTTTGYFLEAALPWQSLSANLQPGDRLGIAASINDNDTPGVDAQECIISTAPQRQWDQPTTWGALLLRPPN